MGSEESENGDRNESINNGLHVDTVDSESNTKKLKYPWSVLFIITNEFCERFSFYGMQTILVLYLRDKLLYSQDDATVTYHVFTMFVYFFPVLGAMVADSFLGKFRTIFYLSILYALGNIIIAIGAVPTLNLPVNAFTIIGLLLVSIGSGGIKPCVVAFGGDQFTLPQQAKQIAMFFSLFYFAINAGSLLSTTLTPILRSDVECFDSDDCYSLAFGIPGILMLFSIIVFICGKSMYIMKEPSGNMVVLVTKCIIHALSRRSKEKKVAPREHWLEYAEDKYGTQLVNEIKALLRVLVLYLPLPVFWALFDQQGSRWTFQATRMNGQLGSFTIKPDQMQVVNPLLILAFIPLFEYVLYPLLACIKISRPLQKLVIGGFFAGFAFVISGALELELEKTYPVLPIAGEGQVRLFNGYSCDVSVESDSSSLPSNFILKALQMYEKKNVVVKGSKDITLTFKANSSCYETDYTSIVQIEEEKAISFFLYGSITANLSRFEDDVDKSNTGYPNIRILSNVNGFKRISFKDSNDGTERLVGNTTFTGLQTIIPGSYDIYVENKKQSTGQKLELGGVFTYIIAESSADKYSIRRITVAEPNSIHMLWLIPQFVVLTMGEVMFSITGYEFSFSQAPVSMKSVLQACWLLTVAFGNVIVIIVAEAKFFSRQSMEFFLFAVLMFLDMFLFMFMATRYKSVQPEEDTAIDSTTTSKMGLDNDAFKADQ